MGEFLKRALARASAIKNEESSQTEKNAESTDSTESTDSMEDLLKNDVALSRILQTRGWVEIPSPLLETNIYLIRNESIETPKAVLPRYTFKEIQALKGLPEKEVKFLHDMKLLFGGSIEIPDDSFINKLTGNKDHMKQSEQGKNSEWKARFLNRLAPLTINCCLKYEKPVKKGRRP